MVLSPGSLLVDRFKIDRLAGEGGMGKVYRAHDLASGRWVAVKQLQGKGSAEDAERLIREARLLAALRHPGIVSYIDHGLTADGAPYLTTEWLEGEDLEHRLKRGPLTVEGTLLLLAQIAEPLAQAHGHGIIHRDLKPSNLFLVDGQLDRVKILDFGIARRLVGATRHTRTGLIVGTPEYMSPEQARGLHELAPAVDVFALGCLVYECLTGRPPFIAEHVTAILIRILFESPEPLDRLVPEAPAGLVSLVHRMLAKEPAERPRDAGEVLLSLQALRTQDTSAPPAEHEAPPLVGGARQLISMVLAVPPLTDPALQVTAPLVPLAPTLRPGAPHSGEIERVSTLLSDSGGRIEQLADGSLTVIFTQSGSMTATDLALLAARAALLIKERSPKTQVAMTTSRSTQRAQQPYRDAIASAERLLSSEAPPAPASEGCVHVDEVTAGLLDGTFEVRALSPGHALLAGERTSLDESRPLLGRPTPCVGRDQDLVMLDSVLTSCVEDPSARAVVVTAPPGIGKSRLRHEFLRRLRARGQEITILLGRGEAMSAGASYGALGQALRRLCGVVDGAPPEVRCAQLSQRVGQSLATAPSSEGRRIAEFLGELCGVPFPDADSPALRAARQDPYLMSERIRESFLRFLAAELRAQPLLLVLEDLHWGDALTVRLIDAALRDLSDLPLMVLALARPEIKQLFPGLWEGRQRQELALGPLSRRACERLVGQVLGAQAGPERVARIVARAGGNALFLEELIRAASDDKGDKGDELPETILAMLHARFARLDERARSVLHAASVFGETFWRGGVLALTGGAFAAHVDRCLQTLIGAEIIEPHGESRLLNEVEYKFRHALVRDAAYGLLSDKERVLSHQAAGRYLEAAGEPDPMVLAEHYERGHVPAQAARCYSRAAEQAHWGGDTPSAIARAQRGLRCEPSVSGQAAMLSLLAEAYGWSGDFRTGSRFAEQALQLAIPGSRAWASALATLQAWALVTEDAANLRRYTGTLLGTPPLPGAIETVAFAMMATSYTNELGNQAHDAARVVRSLESLFTGGPPSLLAGAWLDLARAFFHVHLTGEPWTALAYARRARLGFEEAGHRRGALATRIAAGLSLWRLGQHAAAEAELRATIGTGADFGPMTPQRDAVLVCVLAERGDAEAARALAQAHLDAALAAGRPLDQGLSHWALAEVLRHAGELGAAEAAAQRALVLLRGIGLHLLAARLTLAAIQLRRGQASAALAEAQGVLEAHRAAGSVSFRAGLARLLCAEARHALGDEAGARETLSHARGVLLSQLARIDDSELRQSFQTGVPEHARTLAPSAS